MPGPQRNDWYWRQPDGLHPPIDWPRVALRVHVVRCVSRINADLFHLAACFPVGPNDEFRVGRGLFAEELDDLPFAKTSAVSNRITEGMQMVSCRYAFNLGNHLRMVVKFPHRHTCPREGRSNRVPLPGPTTQVRDRQRVSGQTILRHGEGSLRAYRGLSEELPLAATAEEVASVPVAVELLAVGPDWAAVPVAM